MKIHHIGYIVKNINKALNEFEALGYTICSEKIYDKSQEAEIIFIKNNYGEKVEVITPYNKNSKLNGILKKYGNSTYHICYEVENVEQKIQELRKNYSYMPITNVLNAVAMNNNKIVFMINKDIGLIELVEKNRS